MSEISLKTMSSTRLKLNLLFSIIIQFSFNNFSSLRDLVFIAYVGAMNNNMIIVLQVSEHTNNNVRVAQSKENDSDYPYNADE